MKKQLMVWLMGIGVGCGFAGVANAHLIDDVGTLLGALELDSVIGNPSEEVAWLEDHLGLDPEDILVYLQKFDYPGGFDEGEDPAVSSDHFSINDDSITGDMITSDISWNLTGTGYEALYVLTKDGKGRDDKDDPLVFYYRLYEVSADQWVQDGDGLDTIRIRDDEPDVKQKALSHVSWFGRAALDPQLGRLPDGGWTLAMLGMALLGSESFRRRFKS